MSKQVNKNYSKLVTKNLKDKEKPQYKIPEDMVNINISKK